MSSFAEYPDSHLPALRFLRKLGYTWLPREAAVTQRGGILSQVVLEDILKERLMAINRFTYKGQVHPFSPPSIQQAIAALQRVADEGLVQTNEKVYDLLTLGKSFSETVGGDTKAFTLRYIDWERPENNVYHITEEFVVEGVGATRRPDVVLFVNGIPFTIIQCKRRDKEGSTDEGVSQHIRDQRREEGIPRLYHYAQLLIAAQPNELRYACTGTKPKFWSIWKEDVERKVTATLATRHEELEPEDRLPTEQDRGLYALCRPERMMELIYRFMVFDAGARKVARYQQYFAVQETLERVRQLDANGKRRGGVVWHTQGSGKSLTMVMLSKALSLEQSMLDPRVMLVTDRIDLDRQIHKTFLNCGKKVEKAANSSHLIRLLQDKGVPVITSVINKFHGAAKRRGFKDHSADVFVLVDESHRGQYGLNYQAMHKLLPNACYIGFTGTPVMGKDKNTVKQFGGFIRPYTMRQAVADKAVVPLLYEGRSPKLYAALEALDKDFLRQFGFLPGDVQKVLKSRSHSIGKLFSSEQVIKEVAYDISKHYCDTWQGTGLKAQLAVPTIDTAIRYQKFFEEQPDPALKVNTRVVFTPPDTRQENDDQWSEASVGARQYWSRIVDQYGDQQTYETWVTDKFKSPSREVEILIVVSKYLTGFDAERNTVLYLAKPLHGHDLLQAIARVNRIFEGKEFGYVVDYVGLLGKLDQALTFYDALAGFDDEDLLDTIHNVDDELVKLPDAHGALWDVFAGVDRTDNEAMERHLAPVDQRDLFRERLSLFARLLHMAMGTAGIYERFGEDRVERWRKDLKYFESLRVSAMQRYADSKVNYKEYEARIRKLLDTHIGAEKVEVITPQVDIFNENMVAEALASYGEDKQSVASKADAIAHALKRSITENLDKDEAFYKPFSKLVEETIQAFHQGRIDERTYLQEVLGIQRDMAKGMASGYPEEVRSRPEVRAFYGVLKDALTQNGDAGKWMDLLAAVAEEIDGLVRQHKIRDWHKNLDVQRAMENAIEDKLLEHPELFNGTIDYAKVDEILVRCMTVAKGNY